MREKALAINPHMDCVAVKERFTESNAHDLISKHDVVVDCCDNIATRYVINDECIRQGKVFVSAATQRFSGQVTVYGHRNGPCFRCMYPTTPVTPDSERYGSKLPILSPLPGVVGSIEAVEVLKLILGVGTSLEGRMLLYNGDEGTTRVIRLRGRSPDCPLHGSNEHDASD